ncbi:MAG: hypothetical protein JNG90_00455 [Planctomycetaceae bacterium]|nr:hypothetical protein [Planctomycetaceae bacterium]
MSARAFRLTWVFAGAAIGAALQPTVVWSQQLATTVQLPTFSYFSVQTSVSIPDSGGPYRDLMRRSRSGHARSYSPLNPLLRNSAAAAGDSPHGLAVVPHGFSTDEIGPAGNLLVRGEGAAANRAAAEPTLSRRLAAARLDRRQGDVEREQAAGKAMANGRDAAARGRWGSARIFFETAARQSQGAVRDEALAELERLAAVPQETARKPQAAPK